jgi:hypothetical protein
MHPKSRAERLRLKQLKDEEKKLSKERYKRVRKEAIKERESSDELKRFFTQEEDAGVINI